MNDRLLLTFYGDDFTGSTDSMEALALNGVPTVLFLRPPSPADLERFPEARAVGIAGVSRSQSPAWMEAHLPEAFEALGLLEARFVHYKVCSTFDSSPEIGSIGCAMDIGARLFPGTPVPLVVGAPVLRRYQAFGNLFAVVDGRGHRLDRHPTMSRHPVTPMGEADLRRHLAGQTPRRIALMDFLALRSDDPRSALDALLAGRPDAVLFDVLEEHDLEVIGGLLWEEEGAPNRFVVGSSGFQYALVAHLRRSGLLPERPAPLTAPPVERQVVVSGSASPATAAQIRRAIADGYVGVELDVPALVDESSREAAIERAADTVVDALEGGASVVAYSTAGEPGGEARALADADRAGFSERLGSAQGTVLREVLRRTALTRAVVAGGDTSGHACRELGITALTTLIPIAPGTPLCVAHADGEFDGLEIALKGGQVGSERFFEQVRLGEARAV